MGHLYEAGDDCDENVARALGADAESVEDAGEGTEGKRQTKPVKKARVKSVSGEEAEGDAAEVES